MTGRLGLLVAALCLAALLPAARLLADRDEADQLLDRYVAAYNRKDAVALAALYSDDALLLPPGRPTIRGRRAIEQFWKTGTGSGLSLTTVDRGVGTDTGYLAGTYSFGGGLLGGDFVVCIRRDRFGRWKIAVDIWNEGPRKVELRPAQ